MVVLLVICLCVFSAESINAYCHENWRSFATQDYFEAHGSFAGAVFCAPLLGIALFQLINMLVMSGSALITAKRLQLQRKQKDDKTRESADDNNSNRTDTRRSSRIKNKKND